MADNKQFFMAPSEFTLYNTTDEVLDPTYCGHPVKAPAVTEVVFPNPKAADKFYSAKDIDGEWIPGTVVARDMLDGDGEVSWRAREAIRHILGMDIKSGKCSSKYFDRGLCYLPPNPTKEQIAATYAEGRRRYEKSRLSQAKTVVDYYAELNEARKKWGAPAIPAGDDYAKAAQVLNEAAALQGGMTLAAAAVAETLPKEPEVPLDDTGLKAFARAKFEVLAAETATEMGDNSPSTTAKLVQAMMEDTESMLVVREQFKRGRRGRPKGAKSKV